MELSVKITKLIATEKKLAQGAFGSKLKMVHKHSCKILEKLLIQAKADDKRVKAEFTRMANTIDEQAEELIKASAEIMKLASLTNDKSKVKGMVGKDEKVAQNGLEWKHGVSK